VARYEIHNSSQIEQEQLDKLALFGNVDLGCVVPVPDLESIYAVPSHFYSSSMMPKLSSFVQKDLNITLPDFFLQKGKSNSTKKVKIAIVGKYGSKLGDADYSVMQVFMLGAK
jgi:CTP synthase (UTP-ammonia lyase)